MGKGGDWVQGGFVWGLRRNLTICPMPEAVGNNDQRGAPGNQYVAARYEWCWLVARDSRTTGCGLVRSLRMRQIEWNKDCKHINILVFCSSM